MWGKRSIDDKKVLVWWVADQSNKGGSAILINNKRATTVALAGVPERKLNHFQQRRAVLSADVLTSIQRSIHPSHPIHLSVQNHSILIGNRRWWRRRRWWRWWWKWRWWWWWSPALTTTGTQLTLVNMLRKLPTGIALPKDEGDDDNDDDYGYVDDDADNSGGGEKAWSPSLMDVAQWFDKIFTNMVTSVWRNLVGKVP